MVTEIEESEKTWLTLLVTIFEDEHCVRSVYSTLQAVLTSRTPLLCVVRRRGRQLPFLPMTMKSLMKAELPALLPDWAFQFRRGPSLGQFNSDRSVKATRSTHLSSAREIYTQSRKFYRKLCPLTSTRLQHRKRTIPRFTLRIASAWCRFRVNPSTTNTHTHTALACYSKITHSDAAMDN